MESDQAPGFKRALLGGDQIDWIELTISNQENSTSGDTDISYFFIDQATLPELELTGFVPGNETVSILSSPFSTPTNMSFDFSTQQIGKTINASSDVEWRVFVSEVPEPSSLALMSLGGLALMRRRRVG